LLPSDFPWHWFARHGALVLGLILVARFSVESDAEQRARQRRLVWLGLGATLIAAVGLLVGLLPAWAPDLAAKLLRYYWFRLTDTVVPLVLALWLARSFGLSAAGQSSAAGRSWRRRRRLGGALGGAAVVCFALSTTQRLWLALPPSTSHRLLGVAPQASLDQQWQSHRDWVAVCQWIRLATPSDEVLLTPRHQQTFKWYAGRAEVVNWKDVPQDARSLLEWSRRFDDVFPKRLGTVGLGAMRVPIRYSKLAEYRQRYQTRLMVVDRRIATDRLPLVKVYPVDGQSNQTYSVYELPYGQAAPPR
jgi:hypothetical protein